ncbi:MAG: hypothetical protein K0S74_1559 [Chlamydiales bacterium]|jgi:tetratricopeptide (TPR) repeat protein|nr:hypothetical protein [Chlamydiales bacterium]
MRSFRIYLALQGLCLGALVEGAPTSQRQKINTSIQKLEQQQKAMEEELKKLKGLLGMNDAIYQLKLLKSLTSLPDKVVPLMEQGIKDYELEKYEEAKELFQKVWEELPENLEANFNLGMTYYQLSNVILAKQMFQTALKANPQIEGAKILRSFIDNKDEIAASTESQEESEEVKGLRTEFLNKQKEANSYLKANFAYPKRAQLVIEILDVLSSKGAAHDSIIRDFFPWISETYTNFECYQKALEILKSYEKAMEGKELPDGYHTKRLELEQKVTEQQILLKPYIGNKMEERVSLRLRADREELSIFASQMDQFVQKANTTDADFVKLCERLREFKWGRKAQRHVVVIDRFQNILFSSPEGTQPLERYQDAQGRKYFKDICLLSNQLELKQTEFVQVEVAINNRIIPYIVMYTFVPKHQVFIVVRIPRDDLAGK